MCVFFHRSFECLHCFNLFFRIIHLYDTLTKTGLSELVWKATYLIFNYENNSGIFHSWCFPPFLFILHYDIILILVEKNAILQRMYISIGFTGHILCVFNYVRCTNYILKYIDRLSFSKHCYKLMVLYQGLKKRSAIFKKDLNTFTFSYVLRY